MSGLRETIAPLFSRASIPSWLARRGFQMLDPVKEIQGQLEFLFNLWDRGILQDDPQRFLTLLDITGPVPLASKAKAQTLARNENLEMATGTALSPNSWDNHVVHIQEHNDFRTSMKFRLLSNKAKSVFEFHVRTHESLLLKELER